MRINTSHLNCFNYFQENLSLSSDRNRRILAVAACVFACLALAYFLMKSFCRNSVVTPLPKDESQSNIEAGNDGTPSTKEIEPEKTIEALESDLKETGKQEKAKQFDEIEVLDEDLLIADITASQAVKDPVVEEISSPKTSPRISEEQKEKPTIVKDEFTDKFEDPFYTQGEDGRDTAAGFVISRIVKMDSGGSIIEEGEIRNGKLNGIGRMNFGYEVIQVGQFVDGKLVEGKMKCLASGEIHVGKFQNGVLISGEKQLADGQVIVV